jgi:predicted ATP-binding protein involved in virulence
MKLEHLKLENFRGFSSFEISFDPQFTVLLGENMAGKSAVLDGAAVALSTALLNLKLAPPRKLHADEIRRVVRDIGGIPDLQQQFPVVAEARVTLENLSEPVTFRRTVDEHLHNTFEGGDPTRAFGAGLDRVASLPVVAHYGTQRAARDQPIDPRLGVGSREAGYEWWSISGATHGLFAAWMQKQTLVQLQRGNGYVQPQLAAVEAAVKCCIDNVTRFWFDVQYDELRLERTAGEIQSFNMLSEGVRNMVAMVADIAWRAAMLNPQMGSEANLQSDGVVLIDELDLHLHPAWQRRIIGDLRRTFPRIQFIVTTHSPQIVASVQRTQVRLLDHSRLWRKRPTSRGGRRTRSSRTSLASPRGRRRCRPSSRRCIS